MGGQNRTNLLIHLLNSVPISPDPMVSVTIENVETHHDVLSLQYSGSNRHERNAN